MSVENAGLCMGGLPETRVESREELYATFADLRQMCDRVKADARASYEKKLTVLLQREDELVSESRREIQSLEQKITECHRSARFEMQHLKDGLSEVCRRYDDNQRALRLWFSRERNRLEAEDLRKQTQDACAAIEPESSKTISNVLSSTKSIKPCSNS